MCGDLVSNHGTTGRASIERAEARPSYPILSFAWNHVGAGVVLVQTNPTHRTRSPSPAPPRLNRPPSSSFALHFLLLLYLLFLLHHRLLLVLVLFLLHLLLLLLRYYYHYYYYYYYDYYHYRYHYYYGYCCCCCWCYYYYYYRCCCRYSFATLGLPPIATYRRPLLLVLLPPKPSPARPISYKATHTRAYVSAFRVLPPLPP